MHPVLGADLANVSFRPVAVVHINETSAKKLGLYRPSTANRHTELFLISASSSARVTGT
jgi:hypothetical protein